MGYHSKVLSIFIITLILLSFQCVPIMIVDATFNAAEYLNGQGLREVYFMENSRNVKEIHIEKVSGEDENEEQESLILEKFRNLLGLKSFSTRRPANGDSGYGSPSPSPSPTPSILAEAPAPSPALPIRRHSHPPTHHHHHLLPSAHKIQKKDKGKAEKIIAAAVVSAAVTILLCAAGIFWGRQKFKQHRRKPASAFSIYRTEPGIRGKSKYVSSQNSVKKVTSDPGPDLFYLDSLGVALESEPISLKQNPETLSTYSNQNTHKCTSNEREESDLESIKEESENGHFSASREITCVHEAAESTKDEPEHCHISSDDKIMAEEAYTSDNESFHSFDDSHSAKNRLSNASAGSLSENADIISPNASKVSKFFMASQTSFQNPVSVPNSESNPPLAPAMPPPPPPPPPPLLLPTQSTFSSTRMTPKILSSSTLQNASFTGNSDSSSASNQNTQRALPPSLPNPPKPLGGIPPPPRPPPFSNGNTNSLKGPPPPPPQFSQYTALDKDGAPLQKLKPLHWDKVRAAPDRSTVWDKLRSSSFEFDEEMIKSLFGYNLQNSLKNDEVKSKTPSPSKHVLEPKRLQNITILSKALNMTAEQICDALIRGNGLSLQELEALAKMMPTKEEEGKLSNYKGDINELGSAEKFVKAMLKIPFAFSRIEAMLFRETFDDEVVHLRKSFSMLEEACKELRSSRLFLKLLEAVLKTGNRMNVGTIRGGARAFKLDALLKLADVKATDGKSTLLHFVVQEIVRSEGYRVSESIMGKINQRSKSGNIEDKEEDYKRMGLELVSGLSTELCNVKKTATLDLDVLASSVSNLSEGMNKLHHLVNKDLSSEENNGNFVHSMRTFLKYAERNLKELQEDENRVLFRVREITEYFHGDVSKEESNPLRIFVIVRDFMCMLDHVCKELRNSKAPASPNPLAPFR